MPPAKEAIWAHVLRRQTWGSVVEESSKIRLPHRGQRYAYHSAELVTKVALGNRSLFSSTIPCHVELSDVPWMKRKALASVPGTLVADGIALRMTSIDAVPIRDEIPLGSGADVRNSPRKPYLNRQVMPLYPSRTETQTGHIMAGMADGDR